MGLLGAQERVEARKNDTWIDAMGRANSKTKRKPQNLTEGPAILSSRTTTDKVKIRRRARDAGATSQMRNGFSASRKRGSEKK